MIGETFGDWTVMGEADSRGKKQKKKCVFARCVCGVEKVVQLNNLISGSSERCLNCAAKIRAEIQKARADRSGSVNKRCAYGRYKKGAKDRDLVFSITFDDFLEFASKKCHYCGGEPTNCYDLKYHRGPQKGQSRAGVPFIHNGIDRIDSNLGYIKTNCVTCCKICNRAKSDMGEVGFYEWISRVYHHCKERMISDGESIPPCRFLREEVGRNSRRLHSDS